MSNAIVAEALWRVTQWGVERRWRRLRRRGAPVGTVLTRRRAGPPRGPALCLFSLAVIFLPGSHCLPERRSAPSAIPPPAAPRSPLRRSRRDGRRAARGAPSSSTSRSATERRSRSMSQCVRGGLTFFCSGCAAVDQPGDAAVQATLPGGRDLGVVRERHLELVSARAGVAHRLPRREVVVTVGLVADGSEPAATKHAVGHGSSSRFPTVRGCLPRTQHRV